MLFTLSTSHLYLRARCNEVTANYLSHEQIICALSSPEAVQLGCD
jgi:hypothetical protein